ncbi:MAG TPA: hypothetical protein VE396_04445 [Xanthobacteraceae bacterium]|jgi:hypothetical protein|nr:hypothetical protein [Xanthobacteraceae bacterium]
MMGRRPANRKGKVSMTIGDGTTSMVLKGEINVPPTNTHFEEGGPTTAVPKTGHNIPAQFAQWNLGYSKQDPGLFGKAWHALEDQLFDLLDSGKPLTIAAEGKSYVLPTIDAPDWKARFKKYC